MGDGAIALRVDCNAVVIAFDVGRRRRGSEERPGAEAEAGSDEEEASEVHGGA